MFFSWTRRLWCWWLSCERLSMVSTAIWFWEAGRSWNLKVDVDAWAACRHLMAVDFRFGCCGTGTCTHLPGSGFKLLHLHDPKKLKTNCLQNKNVCFFVCRKYATFINIKYNRSAPRDRGKYILILIKAIKTSVSWTETAPSFLFIIYVPILICSWLYLLLLFSVLLLLCLQKIKVFHQFML